MRRTKLTHRILLAGAVGLALTSAGSGLAIAADDPGSVPGSHHPVVPGTPATPPRALSAGVPATGLPTQVPVGSPGDENHNGQLDSSERPDVPQARTAAPGVPATGLPTQVPVGSPGDENHNGQLDSSERPDVPQG